MIYWFMGQTAVRGKTTLAKKLKDEVMGDTALYLDGDKLREIFGNCYSKEHFTREWREEQTQIQRGVTHSFIFQFFQRVVFPLQGWPMNQ